MQARRFLLWCGLLYAAYSMAPIARAVELRSYINQNGVELVGAAQLTLTATVQPCDENTPGGATYTVWYRTLSNAPYYYIGGWYINANGWSHWTNLGNAGAVGTYTGPLTTQFSMESRSHQGTPVWVTWEYVMGTGDSPTATNFVEKDSGTWTATSVIVTPTPQHTGQTYQHSETDTLTALAGGSVANLIVQASGDCTTSRTLAVSIDGQTPQAMVVPPLAGGATASATYSLNVCHSNAVTYAVYGPNGTGGSVLLDSGTIDEGPETSFVIPFCADEEEEDPDPEDPDPEDPDLPNESDPNDPLVPPVDPPVDPTRPNIGGPGNGNPGTNEPGTNNGGINPVDPALPLGPVSTQPPSFTELDPDTYMDEANHIVQRAGHIRASMKSAASGMLSFSPPGVGKVYTMSIGTFYGRPMVFDLRPLAPGLALVRAAMLTILVICFALASIRVIRGSL